MVRLDSRSGCFARRAIALTFLLGAACVAQAAQVIVSIENLAPDKGNFLTPVWVGFHNGAFDLYDAGAPASASLERLAEDGNNVPIMTTFAASGAGQVQGTLPGPTGPIAPGQTATFTFDLNGSLSTNRYFSYATMIIPSNDAFIANGDPLAHRIFSDTGQFLGASFVVLGSNVLDAGTEVNDELPANTAFVGQSTPNTGVDENGVVHKHLGFNSTGSGGILDSADFANANFLAPGYQVARITVTQAVPEPQSWVLLAAGVVGVMVFQIRRRRRNAPINLHKSRF